MTRKITVRTIANDALDLAAYIMNFADEGDLKAIAEYGGCLRIGARAGSRTTFAFMKAMENVWTPEYEQRTEDLTEAELGLLHDEIAKWVARLTTPRRGVV